MLHQRRHLWKVTGCRQSTVLHFEFWNLVEDRERFLNLQDSKHVNATDKGSRIEVCGCRLLQRGPGNKHLLCQSFHTQLEQPWNISEIGNSRICRKVRGILGWFHMFDKPCIIISVIIITWSRTGEMEQVIFLATKVPGSQPPITLAPEDKILLATFRTCIHLHMHVHVCTHLHTDPYTETLKIKLKNR